MTTEAERLEALYNCNILDTPPEAEYDDIVNIAQYVCETPVALVSLVDADRQWFKARVGFDPSETPISQSVCAHAIKEDEILIIPDLTLDERTSENTLVSEGRHIRFYAGAVLRAKGGEPLGALCVIDTKPRPEGLSERQRALLMAVARQTSALLQLRCGITSRDRQLTKERLTGRLNLARALASEEVEYRQAGLIVFSDQLRDATSADAITWAASRLLGRALEVDRTGYTTIDDSTGLFTVASGWAKGDDPSPASTYPLDRLPRTVEAARRGKPLIIPDVAAAEWLGDERADYLASGVAAQLSIPLLRHGELVGSLFANSDLPRIWDKADVDFAYDVAGRTYAALARVKAEQHQQVLNEELAHRLKNTLSMVQAIASQTLRQAEDQAALGAFNKRLSVLAASHEILLQRSWVGAKIMEVLPSVLSHHADSSRFTFDGPDIALGPKAVVSFSLLFNELATNAVKYGALSNEMGKINIAWQIEAAAPAVLRLKWQETGGPHVAGPAQQSFGSRLIAFGLAGRGQADLNYDAAGLIAEFSATVDALQGE